MERCPLVWWGHGLCAASLGLLATGSELQLSGMRHVPFLAQQGKASLTHHSFFHLMAKLERGWEKATL